MPKLHIYSLLIFVLALPSCATVNKGVSDFFRIDSVPQGAVATTSIETEASIKARRKNPELARQYIGCSPTPCAIKLNRRQKFIIKLEHTATTAGTAAAGAVIGAGIATSLSAIGSTIVATTFSGSATIGTFGLIPIETSLAVANSVFVPTTTSASSAAVAAIPPALAVTGGMLLVDAASGANLNLYPNPVVLELAPKNTPVKIDPNVAPFKRELAEKEELERECIGRGNPSSERILKCRNLVQRQISKKHRDATLLQARKKKSEDKQNKNAN